jgi:hydrogenase maturation protease
MAAASKAGKVLIMGVGNTLMQDDGVGVHVAESLRELTRTQPDLAEPDLEIIDGGTIGLSLLPEIEDADAVIVVDAAEIGERPGAMRVFRNREIERCLSGRRRTAHEVALADLFSAAAIHGRSPSERILVAIQPASTDVGLDMTPAVQAAVPRACATIALLTRNWREGKHIEA